MMKIVVAGSIAYDYIMSFPGRFSDHFLPDKLDRISVSFLVDALVKRRGGVAANIAYNLALLGENPLLLGAVGDDFEAYRRELEGAGVDTSGVKAFSGEYTSSCFISTDCVENQIVSFYLGAMRFAGRLSLEAYATEGADIVIVSPNAPGAMIAYTRECRQLRIPFIFDPSQQTVSLSGGDLREGVQGAKMLILNEYELEMFKKKTGLTDDDLMEAAEVVAVTLGEKGSTIRTRNGGVDIPPARPGRVADPTGVGDAYRAGLLKGVVHGLSWEAAGRMGSLAAAYALETEGPQEQSYDLPGFVDRFSSVFGEHEEIHKLVEG